ncbi:MAG: hypothetical protein AB7V18_01250 [Pyrinomonadaceae bacterium]
MNNYLVYFALFVLFVISGTSYGQTDRRPRVFIEETTSWEVKGDPIYSSTDKKGRVHVGGGGSQGGAVPRTAETMKRFAEQCSSVVVTLYREKADFIVLLEHEGGKDLFNKDNKLAVFNAEGDMVTSGSFSRPKKAVEVACKAIGEEVRRSGAGT